MKGLRRYERDLQARNLTPATRANHLAALRLFADFAGQRLDRATLRAFLALRAEVVSGPTLANELSILRSFFRFLGRSEVAEGLRLPRARHQPPLFLGRTAVAKLLGAAQEPRSGNVCQRALPARDLALVELLYALGLRRVEASRLRLRDVSLADATVRVHRAKRGRSATLPIPSRALPALTRYLSESRAVLVGRAPRDSGHFLVGVRGRKLSPEGVGKVIQRLAARAGVRAHPHAFRRAVATHLVQEGVNLRQVQAFLGHQRLNSTAVYVGVDQDALREAVEHLERLRVPALQGGFLASRQAR